ncbi:hypothetical protein [Kribbella deserti]|uniref:Uncharacterized protein n=1 Tax=Kribbella deserti TaxID=1926257 RepID=A0ABV6QNF2_9ACTN
MHRLVFRCRICGMHIHLSYAVREVPDPDGGTMLTIDRNAIAMHTCHRDAR